MDNSAHSISLYLRSTFGLDKTSLPVGKSSGPRRSHPSILPHPKKNRAFYVSVFQMPQSRWQPWFTATFRDCLR